jgi:hypothetical protein
MFHGALQTVDRKDLADDQKSSSSQSEKKVADFGTVRKCDKS